MINRIRDIRLQKGLTLADVAAACSPPTTAQTIGRLETGMRNLSLAWMNRIAAALEVEPEVLLRSEASEPARIVAVLGPDGTEPARARLEAVTPSDLAGDTPWLVLEVEASCGEYRAADQVWLRQHPPEEAARLMNRDVLAPRPGGRFAFGRLIDRDGDRIALLPPASGQRQIIVEHPAWLAVAEMLVRKL
ncbi:MULTISPECIES: helix-turn-helix domain-containing protein [Novosphingobium]|uniref:XRE family transcriptional regulator n=1 Tax=Novosphingobium pentaromativorans US6-1 TaxID=1088721 RepID=G6E7C9_9SPHN|nr:MULTISPECIES: helix-turn-helix transcriptional regulator [Novosphingobium]AIT81664.1 XRE family transcriptional regulator [Novosphingobium pentaromativorans US6-1]EHJ62752.1 XRE family transcriptional regulator [Novosphingobium pentaromativorans US6-1]GFM29742.1 XRE family transcriptional regulator [Novosphingobium sp. PY1]CCA92966.1 XRE family transcriptional regulator [Novosphingobium sp. PP1Y]